MITLNLVIIPLHSFILVSINNIILLSYFFKLYLKGATWYVFFYSLFFPQYIEIFFHEDTQGALVYSFLLLFILLLMSKP